MCLKNKTSFGAKLNKMDNKTYPLRREVINVLYEIKRRGFNIPRLEVRIVNGGESDFCGYAYMNENIIHIKEDYITADKNKLTHIVLHEVLHAVLGIGHNNDCYLMNYCVPDGTININKTWESFAKYF